MISANLVDPDIVSGCFTAFDRLDYDETGLSKLIGVGVRFLSESKRFRMFVAITSEY